MSSEYIGFIVKICAYGKSLILLLKALKVLCIFKNIKQAKRKNWKEQISLLTFLISLFNSDWVLLYLYGYF
jgi:hypothetical protein